MDPQNLDRPQAERQLLRNIGSSILYNYLTPACQRKELGYIETCTGEVIGKQQYTNLHHDMLGVDCEMIQTDVGFQLCKAVILNLNKQILYNKWFGVRQGTTVTNYFTHITGIDEQLYNTTIKNAEPYAEHHKQEIMKVAYNKVLVGHDLANDLKMLNIAHQAFIDTVALLPHHFGLPLKNKLKDLAFEYLKKHIQWGNHDPIEDAMSALEIVEKHIRQGRGTIQVEPFHMVNYNNDYQTILKDAQLDPSRVLLMVLRGSRALGIQVSQAYVSDWDYVVVYDTDSELDGRLIKLPNVDISFFDKHSFQRHINNNDVSYLQIFFLPENCVYKNVINFPKITMHELRASLGFHLNKSKLKVKRFQKQIKQKPHYEWKILKTYHMMLRFLDLFQQLYFVHKQGQNIEQEIKKLTSQRHILELQQKEGSYQGVRLTQINCLIEQLKHKQEHILNTINIKRLNNLWYQIQKQFTNTKNYEGVLRKVVKMQTERMTQINKLYDKSKMLRYKQGHVYDHKQNKSRRREKQKIKQNADVNKIHEEQEGEQQNEMYQQNGREVLDSKIVVHPKHQQLQTIKFIRQHGVEALQKYKIIIKRHKIYPNLVQLHYMQSASFNSRMSRQCRGLIVDERQHYSIVALPYFKFFDYNDPKHSQTQELDWGGANVYEKKDGSMAVLYYYDGKWQVGSSTVPDGLNNYCFSKHQTTTQFSKQFWSIFYQKKFQLPSSIDRSKTFIFQLMSKNHIIVVKRENSQLCLHGVRDIYTLEQQSHLPYGKKYNWNVAQPLKIQKQQLNIDALVKRVEKLDPLKSEGFVVCDAKWTRIKIKNSSYVRINWLGELNLGFNKDPKRYILMEIILAGQAEVFSQYCPEWQKVVKQYTNKIEKLNKHVIQLYQPISELPKPEFAQKVKNYDRVLQAFLFAIKSNPNQYYGKVETVFNSKKFYTFITQYKLE